MNSKQEKTKRGAKAPTSCVYTPRLLWLLLVFQTAQMQSCVGYEHEESSHKAQSASQYQEPLCGPGQSLLQTMSWLASDLTQTWIHHGVDCVHPDKYHL